MWLICSTIFSIHKNCFHFIICAFNSNNNHNDDDDNDDDDDDDDVSDDDDHNDNDNENDNENENVNENETIPQKFYEQWSLIFLIHMCFIKLLYTCLVIFFER